MHTLVGKPLISKKSHAKQATDSAMQCRQYFMDEKEDAETLCRLLFGRIPHSGEFAAICGGDTDDVEVVIGTDKAGIYLEYRHASLDCIGSCLIYRGSDSRIILSNESPRFLCRAGIEQKKHRWFFRQKNACQRLGISTMTVNAAKTTITQGYFYYPLFGFDAAIPESVRGLLPEILNECRTLTELYEHPDGKAFWFQYGVACQMTAEIRKL